MAKGTVTNRSAAEPRVRRGYFECRFGQLHVHNAIPPGGGFEEGTPLLCLHQATGSGRVFERFLSLAGRDRSVYAPDLSGFGESDPPSSRPSIADYAAVVGDFLDTMRFRQIDVLGYQTGTLVAAEMAIARPKQIRRVVMVSVPVLNDAERDAFRRGSWLPSEDGSHLMTEWKRTLESYGPGVSLEVRARAFAEKLKSGVHTSWALAAAQQYASRERLALVTQSALVLRPKDDFWEASLRARELLPKARFVDLAEQGNGLFEVAPEVVAEVSREFLRG
ncbi:MAG: alpha/beta fold hydrolase [Proteobacteria bacterium]|nr:alpha/beta fold hydrolase [Pseudomonadota bacterium]